MSVRSPHNSLLDIVTCTPISRQLPKYAHATTEKVLQELFSMWSAPCPLLEQRVAKYVPAEVYRGTTGRPFLGNGAVNTPTNC
jgi:hypothetical protein